MNNIGGLVGYNSDISTIENCYSAGLVSNSQYTQMYGGLVGGTDDPNNIINSFWDGETSGQTTSAGGTKKTTAEMKTQSTFTDAGWDFTTIWSINANNYPQLTNNSDPSLPIELVFFSGKSNNNGVVLNWQTATEINNFGFEIERSQNNYEWQKIAFVMGNGNSYSVKNYNYIDNSIAKLKNQYRLKQIDINGDFSYSNIIEVNLDNFPVNFELSQNYPNPFNPVTTINYYLPESGMISLKIYDMLGNEIATLVNKHQESGSYSSVFDASLLASGTYFYQLKCNEFISVKKMQLIK